MSQTEKDYIAGEYDFKEATKRLSIFKGKQPIEQVESILRKLCEDSKKRVESVLFIIGESIKRDSTKHNFDRHIYERSVELKDEDGNIFHTERFPNR